MDSRAEEHQVGQPLPADHHQDRALTAPEGSRLEFNPGSLAALVSPLLGNDLLYHVVVTKALDFPLAQHTMKSTRLQLKEIRRRAGTGVVAYDLPHGLRMEFDLSDDLEAFMYDYLSRYGRYEAEVESALSRLITRETTFIDVGANVGYFTVLFARSARTVYAFEPVPAVFGRLTRNIGLNGLENVRAFQLAVAKEKGALRLFESRVSPGHDSTVKRSEHGAAIPVDAVSLDEAVDPSAEDIVMKVDVEGSEMGVLLGSLGLIRSGRVSAIVVEWARRIYPRVTDLRDRFALYSELGEVEVLDGRGGHTVTDRREVPEFCNLLIRIRR